MRFTAPKTVLVLAAVALLATAALPCFAAPLVFDSEVIKLHIEGDTLRIEGLYRFINGIERPTVGLFYPYPEDSLLGKAWTESLDWRPSADAEWRPVPFEDTYRRPGLSWRLPFGGAERPEVLTTYCQMLKSDYARYIVTTTSAWDRPLARARFEITLPPGAEPTRFSYPFEKVGNDLWVYETERFAPEVDIIVEWEFPDR